MAALALVAPTPAAQIATRTLYDIEEHLLALGDSVETVTPAQEYEFLAEFQAALSSAADKRDRVAHRLAHLEAQQAFASAEITRLQAFKHAAEAERARLESYVTYVIDRLGRDAKGKFRKLEGHTTVMFLRACAASVDVKDEAAVPNAFKRAAFTLPAAMLQDVFNALDPAFREEVAAAAGAFALTVDKRAVKAAIEAGECVPGAALITDKTSLGRK